MQRSRLQGQLRPQWFMKARIRELNKGVARRVKDDVEFEKGWVSFRWPYIVFRQRTKRTKLCVQTAWKCRACGQCTRVKKERKLDLKRCGSCADLLPGHRRKLREIKKEAAKLDHGLDHQTVAALFDAAFQALGGVSAP